MSDRLEGYVDHIVFRNDENGYTVLELGNSGKSTCCVGTFHTINEGEFLEVEGSYTLHNIYGEQFKIEHYNVKIPKEQKALERYLGSGAVKGIGAALAARIVKHFQDDTLRIMEEEPERLAEVKGISDRKARDIALQMAEKSQFQSDMIFLSGYGISLNLCLKIQKKYQERIYDILQENPYRLAEEIEGVGFKTADQIAAKSGIRKNSPHRIKSGFIYILNLALANGHMYLPKDILFTKTAQLLNLEEEEMDKHFMDLILEKKLVAKKKKEEDGEEQVHVYNYANYYLELSTAAMLKDLNVVHEEDSAFIHEIIRGIEKKSKISLDELQRKAVEKAAVSGIFILTGGPGTGKTTTINTMIRYFEAMNLTILLAAPTGRAAKRMQEATGYEASTIHRMLELYGDPENAMEKGAHFGRNSENPLEADVIIIDETSMLDIFLMNSLLKAVIPGTRLVFVGDVNQLPSVGPGCVLSDMIKSGAFPVITLNKIFRQAALSDIVVNAHRINKGEDISLDNKSRDFFFLERNDVLVIQKIVVSLVRDKIPAYLGIDSREIQVLTPMRKGALGVENLNVLLQKYLNPSDPQKEEHEYGNTVFRTGDKVMQVKNNYQIDWEIQGKYGIAVQKGSGVFNGDMGIIKEVDNFNESMVVEFDDSRIASYSFKQLDELELAYAITVHKSQGSEYAAVVMPLLSGPKMLLSRNLLYTAVTRAKSCVVLSGSSNLLHSMIQNQREDERYTGLARRIEEMHI